MFSNNKCQFPKRGAKVRCEGVVFAGWSDDGRGGWHKWVEVLGSFRKSSIMLKKDERRQENSRRMELIAKSNLCMVVIF